MEKKDLTLDEYQQLALETATYPNPIIYPTLGLTGEAGEVSDKVMKNFILDRYEVSFMVMAIIVSLWGKGM